MIFRGMVSTKGDPNELLLLGWRRRLLVREVTLRERVDGVEKEHAGRCLAFRIGSYEVRVHEVKCLEVMISCCCLDF